MCVCVGVCVCACVCVSQGVKRTKLGLREFIKLGDFTQIIDTDRKEAVSTGTRTHKHTLRHTHTHTQTHARLGMLRAW